MTLFLLPPAKQQYLNGSGVPLAGGKLYTYYAGTTTPLETYSDAAGTVPNANPVVLDARGEASIFWNGSYKVVLKSAADAPIWTQDNILSVSRTTGEIYVEDYGTLDPTGATDNTSIFAAAYTAAKAAKKELRLPPGTFKITGLAWDEDGPYVRGQGPGQTIFKPAADATNVITINRSPTASRGKATKFGDFAINLSGRSNCIGLYTYFLLDSDISNIYIYGDEYPTLASGNVGWKSLADQYSRFSSIYIERVSYGFDMRSDVAGGGGLNLSMDDIHIAYCKLGAFINNASPYPMGQSQFTNFLIQNTTHCALYIYGLNTLTIAGFAPEACTGTGTLVYGGRTVKAGHIHLDSASNIRFEDYDHVSNDLTDVITLDNYSGADFVNSGGASVEFAVDTTSLASWDGTAGNDSFFGRVKTRLKYQGVYGKLAGTLADPDIVIDPSFPNEVLSPTNSLYGPVTTQWVQDIAGPTSSYEADASFINVRKCVFGAAAGSLATNACRFFLGDTDFAANDLICVAVLLKSDTDTTVGVSFAQTTVTTNQVVLKAGQGTRVWMANKNTSGLARNVSFYLYPVGTDAPTVRVALPMSARNLSPAQFAAFTAEHRYNPRTPGGRPDTIAKYAALANGATTTLDPYHGKLISTAGALIAAHTVVMPSGSVDGQVFEMNTLNGITALTVNAAAGQNVAGMPAALAALVGFKAVFEFSTLTWRRLS